MVAPMKRPTRILELFDRLSTAEKILLVQDLWNRTEKHEESPKLTEAQRKEVDRRMRDFRKNPHAGSPWEEARRRILRRC